MTFDEYWQNLCNRNDGLSRDGNEMKITVDSFRRSMKQAFEMGEKKGLSTAKGSDKFREMMGGFGL